MQTKLGEIILGEEVAIFGRFGMLGDKNSGWFIGWGGDELLEASWHRLNKYVDKVEVVKVVGGFRTKIL